ncbi:unnamed protein product [Protopolystoma xenopodis]|uniref:Uncharacterized protein n=1 Tax=Protopolystoma xenopodis TaxID=117903 RepID=A0A448WEX5_9PLAT|nr:unnamed protein product [Protopolystoma xenopodis]
MKAEQAEAKAQRREARQALKVRARAKKQRLADRKAASAGVVANVPLAPSGTTAGGATTSGTVIAATKSAGRSSKPNKRTTVVTPALTHTLTASSGAMDASIRPFRIGSGLPGRVRRPAKFSLDYDYTTDGDADDIDGDTDDAETEANTVLGYDESPRCIVSSDPRPSEISAKEETRSPHRRHVSPLRLSLKTPSGSLEFIWLEWIVVSNSPRSHQQLQRDSNLACGNVAYNLDTLTTPPQFHESPWVTGLMWISKKTSPFAISHSAIGSSQKQRCIHSLALVLPKIVSLQVGLVKRNRPHRRYQVPFAGLLTNIPPPLFFLPVYHLVAATYNNHCIAV